MERTGSALIGKCPRAGFIKLFHMTGTLTLATSCKTWGCVPCSRKLKMMVMGKMESGILSLGHCYLITVTLKREEGILRDATFVRRVWTRLLRLWRRSYPSLSWMKVTEATKRGQPHLHLIVGGIGEPWAACEEFALYDQEWLDRVCDCLEHEISKWWFYATGDSYVVDCKPVLGAAGAATYLTKYLAKAINHRDHLLSLGFKRLYSTSRNWPGYARMRLNITLRNGWEERREFVQVANGASEPYRLAAVRDMDSPLTSRSGTSLAQFLATRDKRTADLTKVKGFMVDATVRATN